MKPGVVSLDAIKCCNLAVSGPNFTNFSTRVACGMFFKSLVKILEKGGPTIPRKLKFLFTDRFSPNFMGRLSAARPRWRR
jgi:hypothetical protein